MRTNQQINRIIRKNARRRARAEGKKLWDYSYVKDKHQRKILERSTKRFFYFFARQNSARRNRSNRKFRRATVFMDGMHFRIKKGAFLLSPTFSEDVKDIETISSPFFKCPQCGQLTPCEHGPCADCRNDMQKESF